MNKRTLWVALLALSLLPLASVAEAHPGHDAVASLGTGFAHPFGGLDHLLAMIAVGLWAVQAGGRRIWLLPAAFVTTLAVGAALGVSDAAVPAVELGVAASVALLGAAILFGARLPLWGGIAAVAAFGAVHGLAHGATMPAGSALGYFAGLALASVLLHGAGIGLGLIGRTGFARKGVRLAGGGIASVGLLMLASLL